MTTASLSNSTSATKTAKTTRAAKALRPVEPAEVARQLIPDDELKPASVDAVAALPSFLGKMEALSRIHQKPYSELPHDVQDALVLRRLQQMVNTVMLNPLWRDRLSTAGITEAPESYADWQAIPLADKDIQRDFFMGTRPGLVVPLSHGGFEIVASGGTSGGLPVEVVYSLRELQDTYRVAGAFMGDYQLRTPLAGEDPKWLFTTLADYQMWSSGTMVGGVLQNVPGVNYIGAGPVGAPVLEHMFSYPGPKALMGISAGIAILSDLGAGMSLESRATFRVALYGSGVLPHRKRTELQGLYPNLEILSYFAATQAETIGLQLDSGSECLAAVPGLHLVEIVDKDGRWVAEGEEGELVVTRLHAHEAPLLRLKLGDRMVRRPRTEGPGLKTTRFEFAGRTGDVLHLNDTQYSAPRTYDALCGVLKTAGIFDLDEAAHEVQFTNHREGKVITLTATVDDAHAMACRLEETLGAGGVHHLFVDALIGGLSLFNAGEANPASIAKTGYRFDLRLVPRYSPEIERTSVGKVPLVRDRG